MNSEISNGNIYFNSVMSAITVRNSFISGPQNPFTHVLTQCISSHVLSGLCKISGYEILRHGTSWTNYKSILKTGVDLTQGGRTSEECTGNFVTCTSIKLLLDGRSESTVTRIPKAQSSLARNHHSINAENKFYVFRDSKFGVTKNGHTVLSRLTIPLFKRGAPINHSFLAYSAQYIKEDKDGEERGWMSIAALINALFTPKLKFIYSLEEIEGLFENDPDYGDEMAYRTSQALPNHRIGIIGLFTHANKVHVWEHIKKNPGRCAQGVIQLVAGIFLTAIPGLGYVT